MIAQIMAVHPHDRQHAGARWSLHVGTDTPRASCVHAPKQRSRGAAAAFRRDPGAGRPRSKQLSQCCGVGALPTPQHADSC